MNEKKNKNDHFTIGPLCAYYLAKEAEIKAVRLILSANKLMSRVTIRIGKNMFRSLLIIVRDCFGL